MRPRRSPHRPRRTIVLTCLAVAAVAAVSVGCSDDAEPGGFESARAVVDAHVAASATYDLAADCELRHPDAIAEMAAIDDQDPDGYCEWAVEPVLAAATSEERAATKAKYTDPEITPGTASDDEAAFRLEASDGSYHEDIVVVRVDGRWYLRSADGTDDGDDHDH